MKRIKMFLWSAVILASAYFGYRWDQDRKLDNYFIDSICLDARVQASKGQPLLDGPIFDQACAQMKEQGYNPYQMQQIIFKGYDKALKEDARAREAAEHLAQNNR